MIHESRLRHRKDVLAIRDEVTETRRAARNSPTIAPISERPLRELLPPRCTERGNQQQLVVLSLLERAENGQYDYKQ